MNRYLTGKILAVVVILTFTWSPAFGQSIGAAPNQSLRIVGTNRPVGELWAKTDLYFGTAKPDGSAVTDEEFKAFLDAEVTPRFPDGLTLITAFGQFRNSSGTIVQERSFLLILLYPPPLSESTKKIEEIRALYKKAFQQESVLRVDSAGLVSF